MGKNMEIENIESLSNKEFQQIVYNLFKIKHPEMSEIYFRIFKDNNTRIEVEYNSEIS